MSMVAYTGLQGHGKTYEVVENVIVPSIKDNVDVVTNIAGLKYEEIINYIKSSDPEITNFGKIKYFENDEILKTSFFPDVKNLEKDSFLKPGDILVVDECWRWFGTGCKIIPEHLEFFRMHRHFLHPITNVCCQVVLIVQRLKGLQSSVLGTIETNYLCVSHKNLGLNKKYNVKVFNGNTQSKNSYLGDAPLRSYRKEIYDLYSSYSAGKGKSGIDVKVDKRGTIFHHPVVKYGIPLGLIALFLVPFFLYNIYLKLTNSKSDHKTSVNSQSPINKSDKSENNKSENNKSEKSENIEEKYHYVGLVVSNNLTYIALKSNNKVILVLPDGFKTSSFGSSYYYKGEWYDN